MLSNKIICKKAGRKRSLLIICFLTLAFVVVCSYSLSMDVDPEPEDQEVVQARTEEQDLAISQFVAITGVDPERGKLHLTNTGWNLDLAIASFFEEADETAEELVSQRDNLAHEEAAVAAAQAAPNLFSPPEPQQPQPSMSDAKKDKKPPRRGIVTLGSLKNGEENSDDDSDKQAFYAGGSDRSGQQVLGPSKKPDPDRLIKEMFSSAKEHGGQVVDSSEASPAQSRERFAGSGFRLGSELGEPSEMIPGAANAVASQPSVDLVLKLWRNGFSVDEGELRAYDDPANADFLRSIKLGQIPRELTNAARGEVNLNMEDHRDEDYVMVKKPVKPFAGEGQRLGNIAPVTSGPAPQTSPTDIHSAQQLMELDETRPATSLQIRLTDGTRLVLKLNVDQKVRKIREFICAARPSEAAREFQLMTTFPNKVVEDEDVTIEEANLKSASIVQKLV